MSQQRELDVTKRDRYELLSAYLDGEVSPDERRLVMTWLSDDPDAQCLYRRLLHIRQGFQGMRRTAHTTANAETCTATAVVRKLNYQSRFRFTCMAGLTATAVAFIGVFSGALNQPMGSVGQLQTAAPSPAGDSLEIALDQPPIIIPKSAVSPQVTPMESVLPGSGIPSQFDSEL